MDVNPELIHKLYYGTYSILIEIEKDICDDRINTMLEKVISVLSNSLSKSQ